MSAKSMQINIFHCLPIFTPERRRENVNSGENENTRNRRDHVVPPSGADGGRFFVQKKNRRPAVTKMLYLNKSFHRPKEITWSVGCYSAFRCGWRTLLRPKKKADGRPQKFRNNLTLRRFVDLNTSRDQPDTIPPSGADGGRFLVPKFVENFTLSETFHRLKEIT